MTKGLLIFPLNTSLDSRHKEKLASIERECEQMVLCQYQQCQKLE